MDAMLVELTKDELGIINNAWNEVYPSGGYEENQMLRALSGGIDETAEVGNANGYIGNLRPRVSEALVP